jgi:hypothetical protein
VARVQRKWKFPASSKIDRIGGEFMLFLVLAIFWSLMLGLGLSIQEITGTENEISQSI